MQIIQEWIGSAELLVFFNAKFDLHWLRRYGIKFQHKRIWDVQVAHFVMTAQNEEYPSLNGVAAYHDLGQKHDYIQEKYWKNRIDTDQIPLPELNSYLEQDLFLTRDCYFKQTDCITAKQKKVVELDCEDTIILEEMEWNGIIYDIEESHRKAIEIRGQLTEIDSALESILGVSINFNSDEQLSAVLYGGVIKKKVRVPDGVFRTGKKAGQTKYRIEEHEIKFEQLIKPLDGTALLKEECWSTAAPVLRQLNAKGKAKNIIEMLLKRAELEKLCSGYYEGLPKLMAEMGWENSMLHGTLNQCVAATGRLSSSKPNLQNTDKEVEKLFRSRYD